MFSLRKKISENFIVFVLASFVFLSLFGIGVGMEMKDGQMSLCPFTASQASLCQMSVTEHIARWRQAFLGIPTKTGLFALLIILLAAVIIPFAKSFSQLEKLKEVTARLFAYQKNRVVKIFDPLLIAFSDGILHPKIYEPAHL